MSIAKTTEAFNIGSNSNAADVSNLVVAGVFAFLFLVCAYILLKLFEEVKSGNLKLNKFLMICVRVFCFICILSYFLLH
ncbi:DUF3262 family protein [Ursidibacter sp. B-7004-1]